MAPTRPSRLSTRSRRRRITRVAPMDDVLDALTAQHAELAGIIDPLDEHTGGYLAVRGMVGRRRRAPPRPDRVRARPRSPTASTLPSPASLQWAGKTSDSSAKSAAPTCRSTRAPSSLSRRERAASGAELAAPVAGHSAAAGGVSPPPIPVGGSHGWPARSRCVPWRRRGSRRRGGIHTGDVGYALGSMPPPTDRFHVARSGGGAPAVAFALFRADAREPVRSTCGRRAEER